jgi:hypothetical protein
MTGDGRTPGPPGRPEPALADPALLHDAERILDALRPDRRPDRRPDLRGGPAEREEPAGPWN